MATTHQPRGARRSPVGRVLEEAPFLAGALTLAAFSLGLDCFLKGVADPLVAATLFAWLFAVMLWAAFGVVRHADALAELLGEPYGTLILTISVIGIEVSLIAAVMLTGEASPTLARDTMFAVLMIVLGGLVGVSLLLGGIRHHEQSYNLEGARAFLVVLIPAAVFALVLPKFTLSTIAPTFSTAQAAFFGAITALLYGVFLAIQTSRHRGWFQHVGAAAGEDAEADAHGHGPTRSVAYHAILLVLTLVPIVLLSKRLASLVDFGTTTMGLPVALGGILIALLVLAPEGLAALRSARDNQLQRAVNLLLGSATATIGLTVPAVLAISLYTGEPVILGLDDVSMVILLLTLLVCTLTFGGAPTNMLQGAVHVVLFLAYLLLIVSP